MTLQAGQKYWIEALGKENTGGDHLEIAWQYPGQVRQAIPAQYLATPTIDPDDLNDNSLPDSWEAANHNVAGGEYGDPDNDGLTNFEEYTYGTDPTVADSVPGYLSRDLWIGLTGGQVSNLTLNKAFLLAPALHDLYPGASYAPTVGVPYNFGQRFRGTVTPPKTGGYTFWIAGDDGCELWLSSDDRKFKKQRIAYSEGVQSYGNFDGITTQKSATVALQAGQKYYIEILHKQGGGTAHVEVAWQVTGGSRQIIPAQYLASFKKDLDDLDDDDLPDSWEKQYGLDPTDNGSKDLRQGCYGDYDADGVNNHAEYLAGTDPTKADTFGDGISDLSRTYLADSNPMLAGATLGEETGNLAGTGYSNASPSWYSADDTILVSTARRGTVDYTFTTTADGRSLVRVRGSARGITTGTAELPLSLSVDGLPLGLATLKSTDGNEGEVVAMLPWLLAGTHVLSIESLNTYAAVSLQLNSVIVNALTGADTNGDGIPDWAAAYGAQQNGFGLPIPSVSLTSPVCVEGTASFPALVKLSSGNATIPVELGTNDGWYSNVALDPAHDVEVKATFENGLLTSSRTFTWMPTNVLATPALTIRQGDSLLLTAYPKDAEAAGAVTLTVTGSTGNATTLTTTADAPVTRRFDQPGVFTVAAVHQANGVTTTGNATLTVRSADFGAPLALFAERSRVWGLPQVSSELPVEYDSRLFLTNATAAVGTAFNVNSTTVGDFRLLARTSVDGPILAKGEVNVFTVASTTTTRDVQTVYTFENGDQLVSMGLVVEGLAAGDYVQLDIFVAGVTFQDGTRSKKIYGRDFDANGLAYVAFNYPKGTTTSVCHTLKVYDSKGGLIGTR